MKAFLSIILFLFSCTIYAENNHELTWKLGYSNTKEEAPVNYMPASVPGAVQLDIARYEKYPPYIFADNFKQYSWMEDKFYTYITTFKKPYLNPAERLFFYSKGIDYQCEIIFNNEKIFEQEGMFTYINVDLTDHMKDDNVLKILVFPAPKRFSLPVDRTQASNVVKPPVSYQWDWHPRLIPLGIWDETRLEVRNRSYIEDVYVNYELSADYRKSEITILASGKETAGKIYDWELSDAHGNKVLHVKGEMKDNLTVKGISLDNPNLWWPHDQGTSYLYLSTFTLLDESGNEIQKVTQKVGFKRVRLVMNEGAWTENSSFPKSRSVPPAQFEINGRKIFAKGSNWVNPEIFPGIITKERYQGLIDLAVGANMNIFRIWGGGIINKESFFDYCDEKGMVVWQEFPLACNDYPDDAHYLSILKLEATSIIKRLRKHASLGLWCGGNELFNSWSGMTDQSLALRLLNSLCFEFNPLIPFNPTSPLMGMGHGNYVFRSADGEEVFQEMKRAHYTAYTEFGIPGMSPIEVLKQIIPENELFPPQPKTAWEDHHAFGAWMGNTWLCPEILEDYFGKPSSLEELVKQSQLLQCEGYKAIFEEARRQKPYCAMALNWCYDEPWPAAVNNSLIVYPAVCKPAYYAVKNSCRPFLASAGISKFRWHEGEEFFADLWLLNDSYEAKNVKTVTMKLVSGNQIFDLITWHPANIKDNTNMAGPTGRLKLPHLNQTQFQLVVEVEGHPEYNSEYTLKFVSNISAENDKSPVLNIN